MKAKIHFVHEKWDGKFIIAQTECGKHWLDVKDFTHHKGLVTCEKCLKQIKKNELQNIL
jgi:hypothetical protein